MPLCCGNLSLLCELPLHADEGGGLYFRCASVSCVRRSAACESRDAHRPPRWAYRIQLFGLSTRLSEGRAESSALGLRAPWLTPLTRVCNRRVYGDAVCKGRTRVGIGDGVRQRAAGPTSSYIAQATSKLVLLPIDTVPASGQGVGRWEMGDRTSAVKCTRVLQTGSATAHHISHQQRLNAINAAAIKSQIPRRHNNGRVPACWHALRCRAQHPRGNTASYPLALRVYKSFFAPLSFLSTFRS